MAKDAKRTTSVGLLVTPRATIVVQARVRGGDLDVQAVGAVDTPPGTMAGAEVINPLQLGHALRALWRQAGLNARSVTVALPAPAYALRGLRLPPVPERERRQVVRNELEQAQVLPHGGGSLDFAWMPPAGGAKGAALSDVYAYYTGDAMVDGIREAVLQAGLQIEGLEPASVGMMRAYVAAQAQREPVAILCPSSKHTDLCIYDGTGVRQLRRIPAGWDDIANMTAEGTRSMVPDLGTLPMGPGLADGNPLAARADIPDMPPPDWLTQAAPDAPLAAGSATPGDGRTPMAPDPDAATGLPFLGEALDGEASEDTVLPAADQWADRSVSWRPVEGDDPEDGADADGTQALPRGSFLVSEVVRTLAFYARENDERVHPRALVILGPDEVTREFEPLLAPSLSIPVSAANPLASMELPVPAAAQPAANEILAAAGAALASMASDIGVPHIDLSQQEKAVQARRRAPRALAAGMAGTTIWLCLAAIAAIVLMLMESRALGRSAFLSEEIARIQQERAPALRYFELSQAARAAQKGVEIPVEPVMGRVAVSTTPGVGLTTLKVEPAGKVTIEGKSLGVGNVQRFAYSLGAGKSVYLPTIESMKRDQQGVVSFRITGSYLPPAPSPAAVKSSKQEVNP